MHATFKITQLPYYSSITVNYGLWMIPFRGVSPALAPSLVKMVAAIEQNPQSLWWQNRLFKSVNIHWKEFGEWNEDNERIYQTVPLNFMTKIHSLTIVHDSCFLNQLLESLLLKQSDTFPNLRRLKLINEESDEMHWELEPSLTSLISRSNLEYLECTHTHCYQETLLSAVELESLHFTTPVDDRRDIAGLNGRMDHLKELCIGDRFKDFQFLLQQNISDLKRLDLYGLSVLNEEMVLWLSKVYVLLISLIFVRTWKLFLAKLQEQVFRALEQCEMLEGKCFGNITNNETVQWNKWIRIRFDGGSGTDIRTDRYIQEMTLRQIRMLLMEKWWRSHCVKRDAAIMYSDSVQRNEDISYNAQWISKNERIWMDQKCDVVLRNQVIEFLVIHCFCPQNRVHRTTANFLWASYHNETSANSSGSGPFSIMQSSILSQPKVIGISGIRNVASSPIFTLSCIFVHFQMKRTQSIFHGLSV